MQKFTTVNAQKFIQIAEFMKKCNSCTWIIQDGIMHGMVVDSSKNIIICTRILLKTSHTKVICFTTGEKHLYSYLRSVAKNSIVNLYIDENAFVFQRGKIKGQAFNFLRIALRQRGSTFRARFSL